MKVLLVALALTLPGFTPIGGSKGVNVYKHEAGHAIELAAEGDIPAPPEKVMEVLIDYANHPRWVHNLAESRVLATEGESKVVYQRLDLPVLADRDFTLEVKWGKDGEARWTKFYTVNDKGPAPRNGVVRVTVHEGEWRLEPADGGKATHAQYHFKLDLAGSFPAWMGKGKAGKDIPELFENIRKQVK